MISIIIPALNEAAVIDKTLQSLQPLRQRGAEVILVDGGSEDDTVARAADQVDQMIHAARGRARQMNAGAAVAKGEILWFLHADTVAPAQADREIVRALQQRLWGRFDVALSGQSRLLKLVAWMMNRRSCWSGIATGDQGIFLYRRLFRQQGPFPEIPLMEDVAFSQQLRRQAAPFCTPLKLTTSGRRWEQHGVVRTILLMWWLRFAYWVGVSPARLASWYR